MPTENFSDGLLRSALEASQKGYFKVSSHSIEAEWALKLLKLDPYKSLIEISDEDRLRHDEISSTMLDIARHNLPSYDYAEIRGVLQTLGSLCSTGHMSDSIFLEFCYEVDKALDEKYGEIAKYGFDEIPESAREKSQYRREFIAQTKLLPTQPPLHQ